MGGGGGGVGGGAKHLLTVFFFFLNGLNSDVGLQGISNRSLIHQSSLTLHPSSSYGLLNQAASSASRAVKSPP